MTYDDPGKRNRHVRIEKPTETNTNGKVSTTWALYSRAWVSIEPLRGREFWEAKGQESSITHRIKGTYQDFQNVTADFRIVHDSRTFQLTESPRNVDEADVLFEVLVEEAKR